MKKILIFTQKIDASDPVLGFFVGWVKEISHHFERTTVVCLEKGEFNLPKDIRVFSLGKEKKQSRVMYVFKTIFYAWRLRGEYDAVFVHMNQEYILVAGFLWKILGKKIYLWRNYHYGNIWTRIAVSFCTNVFCTSRSSYTARFEKTRLMPVGIDMTTFSPLSSERIRGKILSLGRIAPDKRLEVIIDAVKKVGEHRVVDLHIYGNVLAQHKSYEKSLIQRAGSKTHFHGSIENNKTPDLYRVSDIFINASPSGMYDKTIFEAAACGCIVLTSSGDWKSIAPPELYFDGSSESLADAIEYILESSEDEKKLLRNECVLLAQRHSLSFLAKTLASVIR